MGVTDTNYATLYNLTALASQGNGLSDKGMWQKDLVAQLTEMETDFNAILTKLDADAGVSLTTYNSSFAVDLDNTVVGSKGLDQDKLITFLQEYVTNFNLALAQLDTDGGVSDSDYASTLALTDVINAGTNFTIAANENLALDSRGYQLGALYDMLNNIVTNTNALNAKLDADTGASASPSSSPSSSPSAS